MGGNNNRRVDGNKSGRVARWVGGSFSLCGATGSFVHASLPLTLYSSFVLSSPPFPSVYLSFVNCQLSFVILPFAISLLPFVIVSSQVVTLLAQAIGDLPDVESIDLSDNALTDTSIVPLLLAVASGQSFSQLIQLDLSSNTLGTPAATALAAYLSRAHPTPCQLKRLFLRNCHITDYECDHFVTSILDNGTLEELDLSSNDIGEGEGGSGNGRGSDGVFNFIHCIL